uniref:Uncharacterized protein n=1 Tax=Agrobacterium vitis TaxID=373 RepID=A0A2Z2PTK1_AGRVI|nr:hypothetical protein [Agrobacterium vitis]
MRPLRSLAATCALALLLSGCQSAGPEISAGALLELNPSVPADWHPERRRARAQVAARLRGGRKGCVREGRLGITALPF